MLLKRTAQHIIPNVVIGSMQRIVSRTGWVSSVPPARSLVQGVCGADGTLQHHPG